MKINQNIPIFGVDTDDVPAKEYRMDMPGALSFVQEMIRRKIAPDATITQDDGAVVKCWIYSNSVVAYRDGSTGAVRWEVCMTYQNTVRPHMIPADLDLVLEERLAGTLLDSNR